MPVFWRFEDNDLSVAVFPIPSRLKPRKEVPVGHVTYVWKSVSKKQNPRATRRSKLHDAIAISFSSIVNTDVWQTDKQTDGHAVYS